MKNISIKINNKTFKVSPKKSILEIAKENEIDIPALCYHPDLKVKSNCRLCVVEVEGREGLYTSCSLYPEQGMKIKTMTKAIEKTRRINLELLFAQHSMECADCIKLGNCQFRDYAKKYNIELTRFPDRKRDYPTYRFGPALEFDSSKCIDCRNCVEVCQNQNVNFLEIKREKSMHKVVPTSDPKRDCVYCGQCLIHCPVGAFEAVGEFENIEDPLKHKDKHVIFQFAPSIRSSIGEEFGMDYGEVVTDKLSAAIRKLGAYKVFDTSVGADFTTYEEAYELIEKVMKKNCACISSCCPSWVKYLEFNYPQFVKNIASTRSPHMILGGVIKTYWAETNKIDPKKIINVSVMPCTSKKYEILRPQNKIGKMKPVDYVLTTRELAYLLKRKGIDLKTIDPEPCDDPLGEPSGAGVIYGASGGVMESAVRSAYYLMTGKSLPGLEFKPARGNKHIKKATLKLKGKEIRLVVVNGLQYAKEILDELEENPCAYHGIEVMACPGGCIGGGGQPVPINDDIRKARSKALYNIDKKSTIREAHKNPALQQVYKHYLKTKKIRHKICHTSYSPKKREVKI